MKKEFKQSARNLVVDKVGKLDKREENDAEDTTGTQCGPGSSAAGRGPRPARTGEREEKRPGGSLVWEDEASHFKRRRKPSARNLGVISEKNGMNAECLVTSSMMNSD